MFSSTWGAVSSVRVHVVSMNNVARNSAGRHSRQHNQCRQRRHFRAAHPCMSWGMFNSEFWIHRLSSNCLVSNFWFHVSNFEFRFLFSQSHVPRLIFPVLIASPEIHTSRFMFLISSIISRVSRLILQDAESNFVHQISTLHRQISTLNRQISNIRSHDSSSRSQASKFKIRAWNLQCQDPPILKPAPHKRPKTAREQTFLHPIHHQHWCS